MINQRHLIKTASGDSFPATLNGHGVAEIWNCSYWTVLEMVKAGTCPVEPIRIGRCLRWPTVAVLRHVGIEPLGMASSSATCAPADKRAP